MITREQFEQEMVTRCLDELYQAAQPSVTWEELLEINKKEPKQNLYERYYLDDKACKCIIDKFVKLYRLKDNFKDHCDIIIRDMKEGCSKDKWIEKDDDTPGYRGYESVPPIANEIGRVVAQNVIEFIEMRKNFYRFNRECESFEFTTYMHSPTCNKKTVIDYWKSQGKDIVIEDRDPDYNYERYWLGWSEEDIREDKEYQNAEPTDE